MGYGRTSGRTPLPRTSVYTRNAYSNGYRRSSSYNGFGLGLGEFDFHCIEFFQLFHFAINFLSS